MPKRSFSAMQSAGSTSAYRSKRRKVRSRRGYGTVARSRGWAAAPGETKYFDCELQGGAMAMTDVTTNFPAACRMDPSSTINIGAAAVASPLTIFAPTQGAALNQRIGRKALVKKIKIRGHVFCPEITNATNLTLQPIKVRIVLLQDKQTNAAQYASTSVFTPATSADATINSFQNPDSFGRYRILKDKIITLDNPNFVSGPDTSGQIRPFKFTIKFRKGVLVNFNNVNGGTVADIVDNSFHILAGSTNGSGAGERNLQLAYYSRVSFKD